MRNPCIQNFPLAFSASLLNINGQPEITGNLRYVSYLKERPKHTKGRNLEETEAGQEEENLNKT